MSRHDFFIARELASDNRITFQALIMAALQKAHKEEYTKLRDAFREISHEYWDRKLGIRGYLRGEDQQVDREYTLLDYQNEIRDVRRPKR